MSYEWFVGLRYLKAKKKATFVSVITIISILGITVGVTALIVVLSVMTGFEEDLKSKILGINAHIVVTELGGSMSDYRVISSKIKKNKDVTGASPFIYRQAMLSAKGGVVGVIVRGLDPASVAEATQLPSHIKSGSLKGLEPGFKEAAEKGELPGIILGSELARRLGLWTGDELNVVAPMSNAGGALGASTPRMARFQVAGIFELGMYEYDTNLAFVSIGNAQSFFRMGDSVTGIEVKVKDAYRADKIKKELQKNLGLLYPVRSWQDMNKNLFSALKLEKVAMFIILLLIIMVAALNIISTLIMVVMQKGKEIAILKSLGATSGGIMKIFMIEGVIIGLVGTLLGTLIGVGTALNIEGIVGLIERTFNFKILPPSVYYIDRFPSKVEPEVVIIIVAVSLAISFLATIYPSWKASRSDPVEGLRYE
ncbi:Lipoprotein releasing system transmembrane protein LolC/LolE [hydrothermal vent metagenome]|uniref:Lipoprotein releasing system transmembrane protein LolC/LolE n=1 Tax=hydrothermal vent metagenome TaxID=652676 RepID=A0A3B0VD54_9ZZZZ